jgi:hypothetical protein
VIEAVSLLALLLPLTLGTGEDVMSEEALLARAEQAFHEGQELRDSPERARPAFRRAAEAYEQLRQRGAANPGLCYDLGTAAYLAGDLPHAILAYRRGLRLAPSDQALHDQLDAAREMVLATNGTVGRPPSDEWPAWLRWLTPGQRFLLAAAGWTLACFAVTRWRMTHHSSLRAVGWLSVFAALGFAGTLVFDVWQYNEERQHPFVVVARDGVVLRTGNGLAYPTRDKLPALNRGVEARLLYARGDWLQIELGQGEAGWVRRDQVLLDEP